MTDAVNIFLQQSINANGPPLLVLPKNAECVKAKAWKQFSAEVQKGFNSAERDGWLRMDEVEDMLDLGNEYAEIIA